MIRNLVGGMTTHSRQQRTPALSIVRRTISKSLATEETAFHLLEKPFQLIILFLTSNKKYFLTYLGVERRKNADDLKIRKWQEVFTSVRIIITSSGRAKKNGRLKNLKLAFSKNIKVFSKEILKKYDTIWCDTNYIFWKTLYIKKESR